VLVAAVEPFNELRDGVDLIAAKLEVGDELKAIVKRWHRGDYRIPHRTMGKVQKPPNRQVANPRAGLESL
jgi:hypothetical protein